MISLPSVIQDRLSLLGLVLNPHSSIHPSGIEADRGKFVLVSPVKTRGLQWWTLDHGTDEAADVAVSLLEGKEIMHWNDQILDRLTDRGLLIKTEAISGEVLFNCDLNSFLRKTLSPSALSHPVLSPDLSYIPVGHPPGQKKYRKLSDSLAEGTVIWVRDPRTGIRNPFHLRGELKAFTEDICLGKRPLESLPAPVRRVLESVGVIIGKNEKPISDRSINRSLTKNRYAQLPYLFHPFILSALQSYYYDLAREGWLEPTCEQVRRRMRLHNEPVARHFHRELSPLISRWAGAAWKPSMCYSVKYRPGAVLERHVDREQASLSLSFLLSHRPRVTRPDSWPLYLDSAQASDAKKTAIRLLPGEGILFDGTRLPHYRKALRTGHSTFNIFFHYVPAAFPGPLN